MESGRKLRGLPRPVGHVAPEGAAFSDVVRTLRVAVTDLVPVLGRLAVGWGEPTTATGDGLAAIRGVFEGTLRRLGVELSVRGVERVPREGGVLFFWNQESHLDHLVLPCVIPRPFFLTYNNELGRVPLYGAHLRRNGHMLLDRTDERQWRASVGAAAERVRRGGCVLVSPEGTRSWDGELLPMKKGAFLLAEQAGRPIVCVTVAGGHERMPRGSAIVRRGPVAVELSEPMGTLGETEARLREAVTGTFRETKRRLVAGMRAAHGSGVHRRPGG